MIPLAKYKWLLFDLDNTLIDFHEPSVLSFYDLCNHIGIKPSEENYKIYKIENNKVWSQYEDGKISSLKLRSLRFEYFYDKLGLERDPKEAHELYILGLVKYSKPSSEVVSLLENLKISHNLAIITNGLTEAQRPRLANTGLDKYFDAIIVSDEIGLAKPQKEYFDHVITEINYSNRSELLIIGDSLLSDILGGMNSDIDTVWYNPRELSLHSKVKPTYEINKIMELLS